VLHAVHEVLENAA